MVSLARKLEYLFPSANRFTDWSVRNDGDGEVIAYFNLALGAQPSQATLDAITEQQVLDALATKLAQAAKAAATAGIDKGSLIDGSDFQRLCVGIVLSAMDALNTERQWITDFKAAVAASTSLANLQTRVAAIAAPAQITQSAIVTAVKAKIAATAE